MNEDGRTMLEKSLEESLRRAALMAGKQDWDGCEVFCRLAAECALQLGQGEGADE